MVDGRPGRNLGDVSNTDTNKYEGSNIYLWPPIQQLWNFGGELDTLQTGTPAQTAQSYTMTIWPNQDDGNMNFAMVVSTDPGSSSAPTVAQNVIGGITDIQIGQAGSIPYPQTKLTFNPPCAVHVLSNPGFVYTYVGCSRAVGVSVPVRANEPITIDYYLEKGVAQSDAGGCCFVFQRS